MPLSQAAEVELRHALRSFRAAHAGAILPSNQGKALEAWVLLRLAKAARTMTPAWNVSLRQGDGQRLSRGSNFNLPRRGSGIASSSSSGAGFVLLEEPNHPYMSLEMHGSLQWKGRSGAKHEIDVSVLPAAIARAIRGNGGGYPRGLPIVAVECKDRRGDGDLDETRAKLARMYDLAHVITPNSRVSFRICEDNSNTSWGNSSLRYRNLYGKGVFAIARSGFFQSGARILARYYRIRQFEDIYRDTTQIDSLDLEFKELLGDLHSL